MSFLQMLITAIVQGVTEFLPISSSGHLILTPLFMGEEDQGPLIDAALHVGTLLAIIVYFFKDAWGLARGGFATVGIGSAPEQRRLFWWVAIGTVPVVAFGAFLYTYDIMQNLRLTDLVAVNLIGYGILLGVADRFGRQEKAYEDMTLRDAIIVGLAQALALIPGTSRSGVTMTAARFLGYERVEAARFSFLLSIPAVAGAGVLVIPQIMEVGGELMAEALITGAMTFVAALGTMHFLMRFLRKASMMLFVVYRVALGILLLAVF
ncbi:undecaprenyl-diphosphate phosphatase [Parasphingopyxis lamellibrachiae]|uniref:Undecaprenyl-diphosphatase n=1 Tax=Parasphingopyxis lamellibrachiae TaxID=680125 RepID=A0A3D9FJ77_9SPHN|nr:undecaprenyl-diphosphate phosphatase [Parasphingopyxis lamellibrachiae]RED17708.1 undecaprenyl-diphosphatase [Parasphingopyxis lamellibrachiae]